MRLKIIIIGIACVLFGIPGYTIIPSFIITEMDKLTGGNSLSPMSSQILSTLGIPPIDTIALMVKYSFVGLVVAGLGIIFFGAVSKNIPKQVVAKLSIESNQKVHSYEEPKSEVLDLLKERLARGEITSKQYQNLKKVLEDKA